MDSTVLRMCDPLTGVIRVEACEAPIKSLELQLVRVETCGCAEGYAREGEGLKFEIQKNSEK